MRVPDRDERRLVACGVELPQSLREARVGLGQAAPEPLAARRAPVDGQQRVPGEAFERRPRGVVGFERPQRVVQDPQILVQPHRARVDAHQAEDRRGLPVEVGRAGPHLGRESIVWAWRQIDQAVVLVQPVVGLTLQVQQPLHALLRQATRPEALLDRQRPEALGDQRRVLDRPVRRTAELEAQPANGVGRLAPVAAEHGGGGIVEVGKARRGFVAADDPHLRRRPVLHLEVGAQLGHPALQLLNQ